LTGRKKMAYAARGELGTVFNSANFWIKSITCDPTWP